MEKMTITVLSVVEKNGQIRTRAHATAQDAKINLEVAFAADPRLSRVKLWDRVRVQLWDRARDEVLRYLDPA